MMSSKLQIDPAVIESVRNSLLDLARTLDSMLIDTGCTHADKLDISTMGNPKMRKFYCHDCDETIEEEWDNVEDQG